MPDPNRLLLVDDDESNLELAQLLLERAGYHVTCIDDGAEALALIRRSPAAFDILILDVLMPGVDGLELVRCVREDPASRHLPVVMVSALASSDDRAAGLAAGGDVYVTKPYRRKDLLAAVDRALGREPRLE